MEQTELFWIGNKVVTLEGLIVFGAIFVIIFLTVYCMGPPSHWCGGSPHHDWGEWQQSEHSVSQQQRKCKRCGRIERSDI